MTSSVFGNKAKEKETEEKKELESNNGFKFSFEVTWGEAAKFRRSPVNHKDIV